MNACHPYGALQQRVRSAIVRIAGTLTVAAALAALPAHAAAQETPAAPPRVAAGQKSAEIRLDGILDEPAWTDAGVIPDLSQQSPRPGGPTPYRTEIRILVDEENLYFGITCVDPDPDRIAVHTMQRDGDFDGDDRVALVMDPFGDHRNGYLFRINATGARQDGLVSGAPEISLDWDGIWDAKVARTPAGWSAEIVIPSRTLRFDPGLPSWGLEVERVVARDRMVLRWSGITLDASLSDLRRAGRLEGIGGLRQGVGLSVAPYGLVLSDRDLVADTSSLVGQAGLDVTYNVTPQVAAVLTVNPDFAETEVDTRQINLTRFPLFFPEKRHFFLEGSDLFEFALGLGTDFVPFFSRRVGLFGGNRIPIDAGVKVLGRAGKWSLAALDVATRDAPSAPGTNLFAGRLTYDLDEHLRLGAVATRGNPDGVQANALGGVDAVWETSTLFGDKNFSVAGWGARSSGDLSPGRPGGWGFRAEYPNDLWSLEVSAERFGDALDPALGFLPRPGTRIYRAGAAYQPRPPEEGAFGWARQFYFELYPSLVEDLHGDPQSWEIYTAPFNVETESGEHFEIGYARQFERLDDPFEVAEGVVIQPGRFRFDRYGFEAESSSYRPLSAGSSVWFGDFYGGRLSQWATFVHYTTTGGHLQVEASAENDFGHLPEGDFVQRLLALKTVYAFTPDLILSAFTQYDSGSRDLGINLRIRWTVRPGDDLYVVWNHNWRRLDPPGESPTLSPLDDQLAVKMRWTFRR